MKHCDGKFRGLVHGLGALVLLGSVAAEPGVARAQGDLDALRQEVGSLRDALRSLQREVEEIKAFLRSRAGALPVENPLLTVAGHPFKGDGSARLTLVEFSDYQCPFCARHVRETLPALERDYIQTGKVRYVFRNFPLESIHQDAFRAAAAARCAGEQEQYWEMHDRLFAHQEALGDLPAQAAAIGLDATRFEECLTSDRHAGAIRDDLAEGIKAGVRGTPAFFLGLTEPDGKPVKSLRIIQGAHPYATFRDAIESLLDPPR